MQRYSQCFDTYAFFELLELSRLTFDPLFHFEQREGELTGHMKCIRLMHSSQAIRAYQFHQMYHCRFRPDSNIWR